MIIDTNALSDFAEGNASVREQIAESDGPYLPVIEIGEYRFGLLGSRQGRPRLSWLEELVRHWRVLDVTQETTAFYADISQRLKTQATPIPSNDKWIAALAMEYGLPVLSNDPHFDVIPGIERLSF